MAMAAEASRSPTTASADSYIGSLISLTSKSEIRYEGVLFNINTQESSIGLRNVRSFGTEGRKKDGPHVPPSDKVYEYILFRGSDIKDLQVKSSPPVQPAAPSMDNDPAIIQSHYPQPQAPAAPTSLPPSSGFAPDISSQTAQVGLPRPTFQGSLPLYPSAGSLGSWGSSPPLPNNNDGGLQMPMYWQGFYGSSNGLPAQQQPLLRPPSGLPMPPSLQQAMQYPAMYGMLNTGAPMSSQLSEAPPSLLPPYSMGTLNAQSSMPPAPAQSTATVSQMSSSLIPDKPSTLALPATALNASLPSISPLTSGLDRSSTATAVNDNAKTVPAPMRPFKNMPEPLSTVAGTSSSGPNEVAMPSLVTPDQLLQPGATPLSSFQSQDSIQKDVDVVQDLPASSSQLPLPAVTTGAQEPLLPLPPQTDHKYGAPTYNHHNNRGGRGRGRENAFSRPVSQYTEEFDFMAMNEKFNKDEVWGHLGKSNKSQEDGDANVENNVRSSDHEAKPVYVKDDFFDSLSSDAQNRRGGRGRYSEQMRANTEAFGNFPRHYHGRGGRGGRSRGGYYGRGGNNYGSGYGSGYGYGYNGRGQGYDYPDRAQ